MIDLDSLAPIDLPSLDAVGLRMSRFDSKYIASSTSVQRLLDEWSTELMVLEHLGSRWTSYTSRYFDTPDLQSYRAHTQGRRFRHKIRSRHYGVASDGFLELKIKSFRSATKKFRWPADTANVGDVLSGDDANRIEEVLSQHHGPEPVANLTASLTTRFDRATLLHRESGDRITIDARFSVEHEGQSRNFGPVNVILEVKSLRRASPAGRYLSTLGLRPTSMSKYCVGVACMHTEVRANLWLPQARALSK